MKSGSSRAVILAFLLFLMYACFVHTLAWNQVGFNVAIRFILAKSLVEEGSFVLDKYQHLTDDKAYYGGRYYCDKPPGISYYSLPVYAAVRVAGFLLSSEWSEWVYLYFIRLAVISLPAAAFAIVLFLFIGRFGLSPGERLALVTAYGLGTMAFPYATLFLAHQLAAVLAFSVFVLLLKAHEGGGRYSFFAGLLGGLAFAAEYQVAVILFIVAALLLPSRAMRGRRSLFFLGLLPGLAIVLSYNYICFDNPFSMGYAHVAVPEAKATQAHGFLGLGLPSAKALFEILFTSFRGLFYISPFLILAVPGFFYLYRDARGDAFRTRLFRVCLAVIVLYLLFTASYAAWQGGSAYGPRMMTPAIPFFLVPVAFLLRRRSRPYAVLFAVTAIYSVILNLVAVCAEPRPSEFLRNPVMDYSLPYLLDGGATVNLGTLAGLSGPLSLVPAAALAVALIIFFIVPVLRVGESRPLGLRERWLFVFCLVLFLCMVAQLAFSRNPDRSVTYAMRGRAHEINGNLDRAESYFTRSLSEDPDGPFSMHVLQSLINVAAGRGDGERVTRLREIFELSAQIRGRPDRAELRVVRSRLFRSAGMPEAASRDLEATR